MQLSHLLLSAAPLVVYAKLNGPCTGDKATGEYGTRGTCIPTAECTSAGGHYKNNACPLDPEDIKCCVVDSPAEEEEPDTPSEPETQEPDTPEPESPAPAPEASESAPAPEPTETPPVQGGAGIAIANPIAALGLGLAALAL